MTQAQYEKRMKQHSESFNKLWGKIVKDSNKFVEDNKVRTFTQGNNVLSFSENLILSGAWIEDRINGKNLSDKNTRTKKVRKALGYNS